MLTERDAVPHGVVLNYDYVYLPSDIGTSGPENRLCFSGRRGVFLSPLGIILLPHWVGVLGLSISSEAGIAMGRVLFHYSKQRHVVGQPDVAVLGLKSRI